MRIITGFLFIITCVNCFKQQIVNELKCQNIFLSNKKMFLDMKKEKKNIHHQLYSPKNENQRIYLKHLNNVDAPIVVSIGPAGTGKTMFACIKAIEDYKNGNVNKIVITRPLVTVEEELGFLPGDILKKMDPWTRPIFDIFLEHISKTELNNLLFNNVIEISPLAFMRGRTFKNAFIIADEMQNSSPNQMKMLTSRIGENSKMVITGDLKQTDRQIDKNGLYDFIMRYKSYAKMYNDESIQIVEFKTTDIERSAIVQKVINIYNFDNKNIKNLDCAMIPNNELLLAKNKLYIYDLSNSL